MSAHATRRAVLAGAASAPIAAVAVLPAAIAAPTVPTSPACTLPPELVRRLLRVRAWYLDFQEREDQAHEEIDRRFQAATGLTVEEWRGLGFDSPRHNELKPVLDKIYADFPIFKDEDTECDELSEERWNLAETMLEQKPQTAADLAYMAEAYLIADLDLLRESSEPAECVSEWLQRQFFHHVRALGALPQLDDPAGVLSINIDRCYDNKGEEV